MDLVLDLAVLLFAFLIDVDDRVVCDLCVDMYGVRNVESHFVCVCVIHHQSMLLQPGNINIPLWLFAQVCVKGIRADSSEYRPFG